VQEKRIHSLPILPSTAKRFVGFPPFLTILVCLAACLVSAAAQPAAKELAALDRYIEQARSRWEVPGLAVAIVKDGKVVLSKGFGARNIGAGDPVNEQTLFAIASNTKAFTATALAMLVDEGKVGWEDPVRDHIPEFQLYDPWVSAKIRVVDLLCHRSGLGTYSGDLIWYGTDYTPDEIIRRIRFLPAAGSFRKDFGYSNLMFIAAGVVIERASGMTWSEFIRRRILDPLHMEQTLLSIRKIRPDSNAATPHAYKGGLHLPYPWRSWDACAAAAGIISSVEDMSRWLKFQLDECRWENRPLVSRKSLAKLRTLHLPQPVGSASRKLHPSTHFRGYGLGWALSDYRGYKIVGHGGAYDGMFSRVTLVPEQDLGIVILTNSTTSIQTALTYRILDLFLGAEPRDWSEIYRQRFFNSRSRREEEIRDILSRKLEGTHPSLDLKSYTGRYGGPFYGDAEIRLEDGHLVIRLLPTQELIGDLEHLELDIFRITWRNSFPWFGDGKVQFKLDDRSRVTAFEMNVPNEDFWFHELQFRRK